MDKLFDYFGSIEFLGILMLSGGVCCLLAPTFYSWFASNTRRFWFFVLTYEDSETQSFVRSMWLAGILLCAVGVVVVSTENPDNSEKIWYVLFEIAYLIICIWLMLKMILLVAIVISSLWNWVIRGAPLFKK